MFHTVKERVILGGLVSAAVATAWPSLIQAATATATVAANIISTMTVTTRNGLGFGDISASAVPGAVAMTPDGSRNVAGGVSINSAIAGTPAAFDLAGTANASFAISLPDSAVLSDGTANTMIVDGFASSPAATGVMDSSGQQTLFVGGTLHVNANQPFGAYTGQMAITVEYN